MNEFNTAFVPHYRGLLVFARRLCHNRDDADDLVHDTYEVAYRNYGAFKPGNFFAWLCRIMCHRRYDTTKRGPWRGIEFTDELDELTVPSRGESAAEVAIVLRMIERLREPHRSTFKLQVFGELTQEETAARLGIPVNTVKSRTARAREELEAMVSA